MALTKITGAEKDMKIVEEWIARNGVQKQLVINSTNRKQMEVSGSRTRRRRQEQESHQRNRIMDFCKSFCARVF